MHPGNSEDYQYNWLYQQEAKVVSTSREVTTPFLLVHPTAQFQVPQYKDLKNLSPGTSHQGWNIWTIQAEHERYLSGRKLKAEVI